MATKRPRKASGKGKAEEAKPAVTPEATKTPPVTEAQRSQVLAMAGLGLSHDDIASVIGLSADTIERYCRPELRTGKVRANIKVLQNLFRMATGTGKEAATCAIFWTKVNMRWHEVQRIIHGFDPTIVREFVTQIVRALKRALPDTCPHCKTNLSLRGPIVAELKSLSEKLMSGLPEPELVPREIGMGESDAAAAAIDQAMGMPPDPRPLPSTTAAATPPPSEPV